MKVKEASDHWDVSNYQARRICKYMGLDTRNIPENIEPVYIKDKRYKRNPFRFYIYVLDVVINTHLRLEDVDNEIIETCVEQLSELGIIILKRGRSEKSVDYRDYIISPNRELFYNWKDYNVKRKLELVSPIISAGVEGATRACVST